ncbi:MAG TPA: N-acetyltransferase [Acidimicrobiales bacterium]|nr:N-acetyltransferase [Acidimicrobiales bacterium]
MPTTPDAVHFRRAGPADIAAVVDLVEEAFRGHASRAGWTTEADLLDGQRTDVRQVGALIGDERLLLAEVGAELLGCCQLGPEGPTAAHLGMLSVRPGRQGAGVGRALVAEAQRAARSWFGADEIRVLVIAQRIELIRWYEKLGFRLTGAAAPFPYGDTRYGLPRRPDLHFVEMVRRSGPQPAARPTGQDTPVPPSPQ